MKGTPSVPEAFALLQACLGGITDPRHARGEVHPLGGVLSLTVLALTAGACCLSAITRCGKLHPEVLEPLGRRRGPAVATLGRLLRLVLVAAVREALLDFARQLDQRRHGQQGLAVGAADGKTWRGVWEGGKQAHVLHLWAQRAALALDQVAVPQHKGEIEATKTWLEQVAKEIPSLAVLTGDAQLAARDLCTAIIAAQRDYVFRLKNQLTLYRDVEELFAQEREAEYVRGEQGHGRLERREIRTAAALTG